MWTSADTARERYCKILTDLIKKNAGMIALRSGEKVIRNGVTKSGIEVVFEEIEELATKQFQEGDN